MTFNDISDVLDEVNLYRASLLNAMENELYSLAEKLKTETELENGLLCILK
jgi:hypothetical protein